METLEIRKSLMVLPASTKTLADLVPEEVRWRPGAAVPATAVKARLSMMLRR